MAQLSCISNYLQGTIVSIFNEDTSLGKKYMFDIRRTCREVYDNARRALYQNSGDGSPSPSGVSSTLSSISCNSQHNSEESTRNHCTEEDCKVWRQMLTRREECITSVDIIVVERTRLKDKT